MSALRASSWHPRLLVCALLVMALAWSAAPAGASPFFGQPSTREEGAGERKGASASKAAQANPFVAPSAPAAPAPDSSTPNAAASDAAGGAGPFAAAPAVTPDAGAAVEPAEPWLPVVLWRKLLVQSTRLQKELRAGIAAFARDIRENPFGRAFWLFLLAGFGYGVLHALGPGHGKSFICGYFLSRKGSLLQGLAMTRAACSPTWPRPRSWSSPSTCSSSARAWPISTGAARSCNAAVTACSWPWARC